MFVGRSAELEALRRAYESRNAAFWVVYGRRRVGKSELIAEFMKAAPGVYLVGKTAPSGLQQREFLREASHVVGEPLLAEIVPESWKRTLSMVVQRWKGPGKLVIALDEFQWISGVSPELPSVIQELWDTKWSKNAKVMLILCGSYVGFMEREVLGRKSPLFGRRTGQILLRPFSYREAAAFHPSWSREEQARANFICGGVPLYLRFFDPKNSVEKNIETTLLDEFAPLFREPDFLLREELRDVESYYAVLLAIAEEHGNHRAIAQRTGLPERSLHYYTNELSQLGYVAKRYPLSGAPPAKRHVRYVLDDPLLRFWFRFVFPNLSFVQQAGPARAFRERIRPELQPYFGLCFERLCREAMPHLYEKQGVNASFQVGEYWDKNVQIDVVGLRDDRWTDLGECKWGTVRSPRAIEDELQSKLTSYPNPEGATLSRHAFVRKLPSRLASSSDVVWHDLNDLYD